MDDKATRILAAIRRKIRPYRDTDICMATKLSKRVVWKRLEQLKEAGLIREVWIGDRPAVYELAEPQKP
jgi:DNA-binding Lrp family transcriptional regulator